MKFKTRFAPSPTGFLHIGSVRTALYSWLFARKNKGKFILRIEDTDLIRSTQQSVKNIIDNMRWLQLDWDEGPYFQSERINRYNDVVNSMLAKRTVYKCYCSKNKLEELRKKQLAFGIKPRYNGYCRDDEKYHSPNEPYVIRFRNPQNGSVIFKDLIHGYIEFKNQELDDLIIRRTDGSYTYNFCVVVDDFDMKITHIIRGNEHLNNTPRQINIFKALCASIPNYIHISMILDCNGRKLSKRYEAVSITEYRDNGFLPEALLNYLVRLGWSCGDKEIFSLNEMKQLFNIEHISKVSSIFNLNKLLWLNRFYINNLPIESISARLFCFVKQLGININSGPKLSVLIKILGKRYKTLKDIAENCYYFYQDSWKINFCFAKKYLHPIAILPLKVIRNKLAALNNADWTLDLISISFKSTLKELSIKDSIMYMPLRVAITGVDKSPPLNIIIHVIGKLRTLIRIDAALNFISNEYVLKVENKFEGK